ncbi:hypothetical protein HHE03_02910 [Helicobacter heilmannii]|uniref:hypothetical protein n=1 Tax=Helicobacter heilmannii TaxID=35817 RepID=UPI0006A14527|nr:hypothetical protein [Helicobacter heilmannii]CRF48717.1 hypothetical protein HHE03_02910 [Helicobacter heilmannii]
MPTPYINPLELSLDLECCTSRLRDCFFQVDGARVYLSLEKINPKKVVAKVSIEEVRESTYHDRTHRPPENNYTNLPQNKAQTSQPKQESQEQDPLVKFTKKLAVDVLGEDMAHGLNLKEWQKQIDLNIKAIVNLALKTKDTKPNEDIKKGKLYKDLRGVLDNFNNRLEQEQEDKEVIMGMIMDFLKQIFGLSKDGSHSADDRLKLENQLEEHKQKLKDIISTAKDPGDELEAEEKDGLTEQELRALRAEAQTDLEELQALMGNKKAKIKALKNKVEKAKSQVKELEGRLEQEQKLVKKARADLQQAQEAHSTEKDALEQQLSTKEGMVKSANEKITTLEQKLTETQEAKEAKVKEIDQLNDTLMSKDREIGDLKTKAQEDGIAINTLKDQVSQKTSQIQKLSTENTEKNAQIAQLEIDLDGQTKQRQKAEADMHKLKQHYSPLDPFLALRNLATKSPTIAKRLELPENAGMQDFFFSKLFKNPSITLDAIAREIVANPQNQDLLDFFESLFAIPALPGNLERLQTQVGDKFDAQMCQMRDTSQSIRGSVSKVIFQGYKEEGKIKHKSLVDVQ